MNDIKRCKCGSYAINLHCHGRDNTDVESCDVCYWRHKADHAIAALKAKSEAEVVCAWVTTGKGCGFAREAANEVKLFTFEEDCVIHEAPTLADLAKKIGEVK